MSSHETASTGSAPMKHDLNAQLVWIPKYRKKVLPGQVALRVRDLIRQIPMEHKVAILSGKVASDHIHVVAYRPHANINRTVPCDAVNWSVATSSVENVTSE